MKRRVNWAFGLAFAGLLAGGLNAQILVGTDGEAFLSAIRDQDGAKVESIAGKGANVVNYRGYDGDTPLTIAAAKRSGTYIAYLLGKGADTNLSDRGGDTPLMIAARSGFNDGIERLLRVGANVDATNRKGETALIAAVQRRHPLTVRRLLEAGADADKADFAAGFSARDYARRDTRNPDLLRLIETVKPARRAVSGPARN